MHWLPLFNPALAVECADAPADCNMEAVRLFESGNRDAALPLLEAACAVGEGQACNNLGLIAQGAGGSPVDAPAARGHYQRGCEAGYLDACNNHGIMLWDGLGGAVDYPASVERFAAACPTISGACFNLAKAYRDGSGVDADQARAGELFAQSCDSGTQVACQTLQTPLSALRGSYRADTTSGQVAIWTFTDRNVTVKHHWLRQEDTEHGRSCVLEVHTGAVPVDGGFTVPLSMKANVDRRYMAGGSDGCVLKVDAGDYAARRYWGEERAQTCDDLGCRERVELHLPDGRTHHLVPILDADLDIPDEVFP